jgi:hypothetical protein
MLKVVITSDAPKLILCIANSGVSDSAHFALLLHSLRYLSPNIRPEGLESLYYTLLISSGRLLAHFVLPPKSVVSI